MSKIKSQIKNHLEKAHRLALENAHEFSTSQVHEQINSIILKWFREEPKAESRERTEQRVFAPKVVLKKKQRSQVKPEVRQESVVEDNSEEE